MTAYRLRAPDPRVGHLLTRDYLGRDEDQTISHAELSLGAGMIMVDGPREDGWLGSSTPDPFASTVSLYIVIDDPRGHYERAKAEGATIVGDLQTTDHGSTEYPEGNLWSFGSDKPS